MPPPLEGFAPSGNFPSYATGFISGAVAKFDKSEDPNEVCDEFYNLAQKAIHEMKTKYPERIYRDAESAGIWLFKMNISVPEQVREFICKVVGELIDITDKYKIYNVSFQMLDMTLTITIYLILIFNYYILDI